MFSPYILLGVVLGSLGLGVIGYFKGDADAAHRYQAKITAIQVQAKEDAQQAAQAMLIQSSNAATGLEAGNAKARVIYKTITQQVDHEIERPIYLSTCFSDDGVRLANAALGGVAATPPDPSKPDPGMPRVIGTH